MKNVFIIGSKGIPARYGGFETFVDQLTTNRLNEEIKYHVACLADKDSDIKEFTYNSVRCFNIKARKIGGATAVLYDLLSLRECIRYIREYEIKDGIVYILACRIGPFFALYKRKLEKLGIKVFVNPDGHEWKRSKWNYWIRKYWKISERMMVKHADLLVCDSRAIEDYIRSDYRSYQPKTTFIAYGADSTPANVGDEDEIISSWMNKFEIKKNNYYLIVGRFVPENNYELMIREFMKSNTTKDLVVISNVEVNSFYKYLLQKTGFDQDSRIKLVGTVYDQELLKKIRELSYGYLHGHEVGGTNPSLLEALAMTKLNLLLDVSFNREVGSEGAVYFTKGQSNLASLIQDADQFDSDQIKVIAHKAKERIQHAYSWDSIIQQYEELFVNEEYYLLKEIHGLPSRNAALNM